MMIARSTHRDHPAGTRPGSLSFFDACTLVDPGLVLLPGWERDRERVRSTTTAGRLPVYAGVGRVR